MPILKDMVAKEPEDAAPPQETAQDNAPPPEQPAASLPEEKICALEAEIAALKDQRVRALAETENVRKRAQRDLEETARYAVTPFARDMVNVLENLNRASENIHAHAAGSELIKTLDEGVGLTLKEMLAIFERYGIRRIDPLNQKFDHNFHQAVAQVEKNDVPAGTVVQVVQAGYTIHNRLLRPAMVAVSKAAAEPPKPVDTEA